MIPWQLSPGDDSWLAIFSSNFHLRCQYVSCLALTMNADNKQITPDGGQKTEISEPTRSIGTEWIKSQKFDAPVSCEFIPELSFPWNGAFLEWQKGLQNYTKPRVKMFE